MRIVLAFAALLVATFAMSCEPSRDHALRVLSGAGYEHVELRGYPFFSCGDSDRFNVAFSAVGANGLVVTGAVCCGWFKNCTVRLD